MNGLSRCDISITDMPVPRQSSSSSRTWVSTDSGSVAGPAAKLKTLFIVLSGCRRFRRRRRRALAVLVAVLILDPVEADQAVVLVRAHHAHALGVAALDADFLRRRAD